MRAKCPDCHVPHDWTDKIARKMQASKEVWGKIFGTIDTREKFEAHRLELAQARVGAAQGQRLARMPQLPRLRFHGLHPPEPARAQQHSTYLANGEQTCIDCHKGISHKLPYIPPGEAPTDTPGQVVPTPDGRVLAPSPGNVAKATPLVDARFAGFERLPGLQEDRRGSFGIKEYLQAAS